MQEILSKLQELDLKLQLKGDSLEVIGKKERLTPELIQEVRTYKEELINFLKKNKKEVYKSISKVEEQPFYPASYAQKQLWLLNELNGAESAYHINGVFLIEGTFDVEVLQHSFLELIKRHESLRTSFRKENEEPVQVVHPISDINFEVEQSDWDEEDLDFAKMALMAEAKDPFNLECPPLLRAELVTTKEDKKILSLTLHHIIADGWSMEVLMSELITIYIRMTQGEYTPAQPLEIQYKDYAAWQEQQLSAELVEEHKSFWMETLAGELPVVERLNDFKRPDVKTYNGETKRFVIEADLFQGLKEVTKKNQTTLFMSLMAMVNTLLFKYTGQKDLIVGSPMAGRGHADLEKQIGFYVNMLPFRTAIDSKSTFEELLQQIKTMTLNVYDHQLYPFDQIVNDLRIKRDSSRSPLFDIVMALQNTSINTNEGVELENVKVTPIQLDLGISKYDMLFDFREAGDLLELGIQYNSDLFREEKIEQIAEHFKNLLQSVVNEEEKSLAQLSFLGTEEMTQLNKISNADPVFCEQESIVEIFEQQVEANPDKIAVVAHDVKLSYKELNQKANRLAHYLRNNFEIKPNSFIGLHFDRNEKMIVGILAVLKAGAGYLPLDVNYPLNRKLSIVNDSGINIILCDSVIDQAVADLASPIEVDQIIDQEEVCTENLSRSENTNAYVMFTSGTTGNPKGVVIKQKSVVGFIQTTEHFNFSETTNSVLIPSYSFDGSIYDIFGTLLNGGTLFIPTMGTITSYHKMGEYITGNEINNMFISTAYFNMLVEALPSFSKMSGTVIFGGEAASPKHVKACLKNAAPSFRLLNAYGPTECTVFTTLLSITDPNQEITIGRPLEQSSVFILDDHLNQVPVGVTGEIYVGGNGLASGYLNNKKTTDEKFINLNGRRLYKTGDEARWTAEGTIAFEGRKDRQVKIRGYRIELEEIEEALMATEMVKTALIDIRSIADENKILTWVITKEAADVDLIKQSIQTKLPSYMIPYAIIKIEEVPLNSNGKVDYKALPNVDEHLLENDGMTAPETKTEKLLAAIWATILGKENPTTEDNFFELGGHSLLAIKIIARVFDELEVRIELEDIFKHPTIRSLAVKIEEKEKQLVENSKAEDVEEFIL